VSITERDKLLKHIAAEVKRIHAIPASKLDDSMRDTLTIARNFLRSITHTTRTTNEKETT
jgi:ribosomal protein S25